MNYNEYIKPYLCHHGILGMKWGVRRYQNPDGSLTEAGRKRYYSTTGGKRLTKAGAKEAGKDLAKLSKIALKEGYENYFGADYKKQLAYIQRKWGENADGMADWASEHKGALDKADRLLAKAQKRLDKEKTEHDPFPNESNDDPSDKIKSKRMDRMVDKYIKLSNKKDDAILSGNKSLADKYDKKQDSLSMKIVNEGDRLAKAQNKLDKKRRPNDPFSKALNDDQTTRKVDKDYWRPDQHFDKHAKDVADLGLKALAKMGRANGLDMNRNGGRPSDFDRGWFLYEDQTIGLPTAAHLINKGHSAADVKKYYKTLFNAYKANYTGLTTGDEEKYFDAFEAVRAGYDSEKGTNNTLIDFIDACEAVKKNNRR